MLTGASKNGVNGCKMNSYVNAFLKNVFSVLCVGAHHQILIEPNCAVSPPGLRCVLHLIELRVYISPALL